MTDEIGSGLRPKTHNLLGSSGRIVAWEGAIHQGDQRPLLGYGFGTEDRVFVDRFRAFAGRRPEEAWLGMYLQLGIVGVVSLAALVGLALLRGWQELRRGASEHRFQLGACVAVVLAGCAETLVQSFVYSAGDIAALSFWVCAALLIVAGRGRPAPGVSRA